MRRLFKTKLRAALAVVFVLTAALLAWAFRLEPTFVSGGVGASIIPARFRVPPEIVILSLEPSK